MNGSAVEISDSSKKRASDVPVFLQQLLFMFLDQIKYEPQPITDNLYIKFSDDNADDT